MIVVSLELTFNFYTFTNQGIKVEQELRYIENGDWITLLLGVVLLGITVLSLQFPQRLQEFVKLPLTDQYFNIKGRAETISHPFNLVLFGIQVISFSVFLYGMVQVFQPEVLQQNKWFFVQLITGITIFILLRYILEKIVAYIFDMEGVIQRYLYEKLTYTSLIALLIFGFNLIIFYAIEPSELLFRVLIPLIVVLYLISLVSSFKRNWTLILRHFFYFILYLCALEIAPYILLYRVLV